MSLTIEERQKWFDVLERTNRHRNEEKKYPEEYAAYLDKVVQETIIVPTTIPVKCIITTPNNKIDNCPVHINMHGGGFIHGQDHDDDLYCAKIAYAIKGIVVDIDYATSDKHPFPAAFDQCYEVVKWAFDQCATWHADPKRISIGGHSAGGCLVAAISLKAAKTKDFKTCLQILDYAANDNSDCVEHTNEQNIRSAAFSMLYADGDAELLKDPYVSPVFATDDMLYDQPRTLIINAKNCPFCTVNENYGLRLVQAGNEVIMKRFTKSMHGFTVRMAAEWLEAQDLIIKEINAASL